VGNVAVFASGGGTNFQAIADALKDSPHQVVLLVCDKKKAQVRQRALDAGIPVESIVYRKGRTREEAEQELLSRMAQYSIDLIALAGFMRLLSPLLVDAYKDKILNIHPSLLPKYPGTRGIEESFYSGDDELGITIHRVDYGLDTGSIIRQGRISRIDGESLKDFESRIHALEHRLYPEVIFDILERHIH
jgi:phosphoribosylglycinamide formyltransferase 1